MKIPIKPLCEEKRIREDGTAVLYFQWFHDGVHRIFLNTGITIPPKFWNKKTEAVMDTLPSSYGTPEKLNAEVDRQLHIAKDLIRLAKNQKVHKLGAYVKRNYRPDLDLPALALADFQLKTSYIPENEGVTEGFFKELDDYVKSKSKWVKKAMLTVYGNMIGHYKAFEEYRKESITFSSFDYQFYEDFRDFLTFEYPIPRKKNPVQGLRINTIGKTIKQFRIFIRDKIRRKSIPAMDLSAYKIPEEETDAIYLTYEEIGKIYHLDLSECPELEPYRRWFVLACLTGLRFSDFSALRPEDLQQDMLYKKQEKSEHWVVIPLRKEAKDIFTEHFKTELPAICNSDFNKKIKDLARMAGICQTVKFSYKKGNKMIQEIKPKWAWITSHTARRSFCTNEFLKGTPVYLIMRISGHRKEKDFYKYIRITPEEAAQKIKVLWMERDDMEVFKNPLKRVINMHGA